MRVVVITGSRNWTDRKAIQAALEGADLLIHGGARGADLLAQDVALGASMDVLLVPANWKQYGKSAGMARNSRIAMWASRLRNQGYDVVCYAFPMPDSRGTWDCVEKVRAFGIPTTVHGEEALP